MTSVTSPDGQAEGGAIADSFGTISSSGSSCFFCKVVEGRKEGRKEAMKEERGGGGRNERGKKGMRGKRKGGRKGAPNSGNGCFYTHAISELSMFTLLEVHFCILTPLGI